MKKLIATTVLTTTLLANTAFSQETKWSLDVQPKAKKLFQSLSKKPSDNLLPIGWTLSNHSLIVSINSKYNDHITWTEDKNDIWQRPDFTIKSKKGDCEDFAFAKWEALKAKGIPVENMRFAVGYYQQGEIADWHLYLKVQDGNHTYHLDNNSSNTAVAPFETPLYEFDENGVYFPTKQ